MRILVQGEWEVTEVQKKGNKKGAAHLNLCPTSALAILINKSNIFMITYKGRYAAPSSFLNFYLPKIFFYSSVEDDE